MHANTHTHTRTHARTHTRAHTRIYIYTYTVELNRVKRSKRRLIAHTQDTPRRLATVLHEKREAQLVDLDKFSGKQIATCTIGAYRRRINDFSFHPLIYTSDSHSSRISSRW